jgi:ubiquitin-conjugating enzyme E2 J2
MSDFHPESWNPMWSVSTILTGLYSFMLDSNPTLGSIETSDRKKRQLAASSLAYNVKDGAFVKLFPEYVELYQERLEKEAATRPPTAAVVSVDRPDNTEMAMGATLAGILAILSIVMAFQFLL